MNVANSFFSLIILFSSCHPTKNSNVVVQDEPKQKKDLHEVSLDSLINGALGIKTLHETEAESKCQMVRFSNYDAWLSNSEIYQVTQSKNKTVLNYWKFKVDPDCNPWSGYKAFDTSCVSVLDTLTKEIKIEKWDTLQMVLMLNEFWELSEVESEIQQRILKGEIYHGPTWMVESCKTLEYDYPDTTMFKNVSHRIERFYLQEYKSITNIGNFIQSLK